MDLCQPFEPNPALAIAVSGGADSMALALLAHDWAARREGTVHALVVDHGLRPESAAEAKITVARLATAGIPATLLPLTTLHPGPALAERARLARYEALTNACRAAGQRHLLLGHHAADQIETMMMRALGSSLDQGLAAMPLVSETRYVRILRPLLATPPGSLRRFLINRGIDWVEDPSNRNRLALRPRLRQRLSPYLTPAATDALLAAARSAGHARMLQEAATAVELATRATIHPQGFATLSPGRIAPAALASLIQTIGGAPYGPSLSRIAELAARPRPATVAGIRILPAGRLAPGLLVVREEAAIAPPLAAHPNVIWDRRMRLIAAEPLPLGATIGKLGPHAARFRRVSPLPAVILRTLPAIWLGKMLAAVPHLGYAAGKQYAGVSLLFDPPKPLAGATFLPK